MLGRFLLTWAAQIGIALAASQWSTEHLFTKQIPPVDQLRTISTTAKPCAPVRKFFLYLMMLIGALLSGAALGGIVEEMTAEDGSLKFLTPNIGLRIFYILIGVLSDLAGNAAFLFQSIEDARNKIYAAKLQVSDQTALRLFHKVEELAELIECGYIKNSEESPSSPLLARTS